MSPPSRLVRCRFESAGARGYSAFMDATVKRKLPIGIQTFRLIREGDCYYVDKTALIQRLVAEGRHYFLLRPRRFGKSLLLDTIKELFEGSEVGVTFSRKTRNIIAFEAERG